MPLGNQNTSGAKGRNVDFQKGIISILKGNNSLGSFTLSSGTYTITDKDKLSTVAMYLSSGGSATIQGDAKVTPFGGASTAVAMIAETPTVISCSGGIKWLQLVISSGTVEVFCN
jgi:hypothetical protein